MTFRCFQEKYAPQSRLLPLFVAASAASSAVAAHAGPKTRLLFNLGMRGEVLGSDLDSRVQFDSTGQISTLNTRLSGGSVQGEVGDTNATWGDLSLASRSFLGLKLGLPTGKIATTLMGGQVAVQDLRGNSSLSPIYGLRAGWNFHSNFSLSASQLVAPAVSEGQGRFISALSLAFSPQLKTRLALEMARSEGGNAWQMSALHATPHLGLKALYRAAAAGFSSAGNPDLIRQRSGYAGEIHYQSGPFALDAGSQRFEDGRQGREFVDNASLGFSRRGWPSVALFYQRSEQLALPFAPLETPLETPLGTPLGTPLEPLSSTGTARRALEFEPLQSHRAGVQISHSWAATNLSLGFDRTEGHLTNTPMSAQNSDRISLSLARPLGNRTSARFFQSWNLRSAAQANANSTGQVTQFTLNHRLASGLSLNVGLQRQQIRSNFFAGNALISDIGVSLPLGRSASVEVQLRTALNGSSAVLAGSDRLQIRFSRNFNVGRGRNAGGRTAAQRRALSHITGRVFEDLNNDGRWQSGEPPIAGVAVALRGGAAARSDKNGNYRFDDIAPLPSQVALVGKTLPIEFAVLAPTAVPIVPVAGQTISIDFAAVRTGQIRGLVFEDLNRNGQRESDEKLLPDVMVQVENSEVISFSNERGEFLLSNLPPQTWKISADTSSLSGDYEATASSPSAIKIAPNGTVSEVLLGLAPQIRAVVTTFQKSQ